jgi:hypothetical protein
MLTPAEGPRISRYSAAGVATAAFPGAAGTYDIIVAYFDEQDGQSTLAVTVNGEVVDTWLAGAGFPDSGPSAVTLTYRVVATGFPLAPGDVITLEGSEQGSEFVRVDKVDFVPVSSGEEVMGNKRWWRWRAARICWGRSSSTPGVRGR